MRNNEKVVGTLLPLFALRESDFTSAQVFLKWLNKTNQSAWLLLPLHETQLETGSKTKHVPSPYKSYGIGLDPRYLPATSLRGGTTKQSSTLSELSRGLPHRQEAVRNDAPKAFMQKHKEWILDYALFCALRDYFGTDDWTRWDLSIRRREKDAVDEWTAKLKSSIDKYVDQQFVLHQTYAELHEKAHEMGISLIGDLPYYPSVRSPLVWAHQDVFQINDDGSLPFVSGIPDTQWTHFGRQVWGHPLYNWDDKKEIVISFWKLRLRYLASIFDHVRFDHAKAFFAYGVMDVNNPENDDYHEGPGVEVFKELVEYGENLGLSIFAEDSGDKTALLRKTMNEMHIAGLRIFRFALRSDEINPRYADLTTYPENCVAYTTTHDTETLLGYVQSLNQSQKAQLEQATGIPYNDDKSFTKALRNAVVACPAKTVIVPIQDWLLTTDRINIPGTEKEINDENWHFKLPCSVEELPTEL